MKQQALTVIARIKRGELESLSARLDEIGRNPGLNEYVSFSRIASVHFASWIILANDPTFAPLLVFESNYDGDLEHHLDELITHGARAFDTLYGKCEGYPPEGTAKPSQVKAYLRNHDVPPAAFFVGFPDQTVSSICNATAVREEIQRFLDREQDTRAVEGLSAIEICERIKRHLQQQSPVRLERSLVTLAEEQGIAARNRAMIMAFGLPLSLLLSPVLMGCLVAMRLTELSEQSSERTREDTPAADPRLIEMQDLQVQNHMVTLVSIKPGTLRRTALKTVLWFYDTMGRAIERTGNILGISTIHFVRWLLIDDERRLLFLANYDGSWVGYLGDFVDCASFVLTSIWGNTEGFPAPRWFFWGGARNFDGFRQWTRNHNLRESVWYSAYLSETVRNLAKDLEIRDSIIGLLTPTTAEQLLRLL